MNNADMPATPVLMKAGEVAKSEGGLTKREYFAGLAMQGLAAGGGYDFDKLAQDAARIADELLAELEKRGEA